MLEKLTLLGENYILSIDQFVVLCEFKRENRIYFEMHVHVWVVIIYNNYFTLQIRNAFG